MTCRAVRSQNGTGRFGPDLTHLMSRHTLASGAAENTPENLRLWIENPDAIKPGSLMPAMKLSDADLEALVRYLDTLREPRNLETNMSSDVMAIQRPGAAGPS